MQRNKYAIQHLSHQPTLEQQLENLPNAIAYVDERQRRKLPANIQHISVPHETATALVGDWLQVEKRANTFLTVAAACVNVNGNMPLLMRAGIGISDFERTATAFNQHAAKLVGSGLAFLVEHTQRLGEAVELTTENKGHNPLGIRRASRVTATLLDEIPTPKETITPKELRRVMESVRTALEHLHRSTMKPKNRATRRASL